MTVQLHYCVLQSVVVQDALGEFLSVPCKRTPLKGWMSKRKFDVCRERGWERGIFHTVSAGFLSSWSVFMHLAILQLLLGSIGVDYWLEVMSGKLDATTGLTCICCRVVFANSDIQREHYRTDWHRYNLKRKVQVNWTLHSENCRLLWYL